MYFIYNFFARINYGANFYKFLCDTRPTEFPAHKTFIQCQYYVDEHVEVTTRLGGWSSSCFRAKSCYSNNHNNYINITITYTSNIRKYS